MAVQIRGLSEMARGLNQIDRTLTKPLAAANKKVSEKVVASAGPRVQGLSSPGGSKAVSGLRARSTPTEASVVLLGSNPTIRANVLGTLSHVAWGRRKAGSKPFLPWVGQSWTPEDLYGLGPALTEVVDGFALDEYLDAFMDGLRPAFPD